MSFTGRVGRRLDRLGLAACFVWGVAEATLFFVVPDVGVGALALHRRRRALAAAAAAIAGALVGGIVLILATRAAGPGVLDVLAKVPGVPDRMIVAAGAEVDQRGAVAMLLGPLRGTPYKLYAAQMTLKGWSLLSLLAWTVPARAIRIVPVALLSALVGRLLRRPVSLHPLIATGVYLLPWYGIYVAYFSNNGF
ncbi:MAG: hypothetical protein ACRD0Q_00325 [Acidimicrobiales bacterium]